jgi:hypothetical protein
MLQLTTWLVVVLGIVITLYLTLKYRKLALFVSLTPIFFYIPTLASPFYFNYTITSIDIDTSLKQSEREASIPHIIEAFSSDPRRNSEAELLVDLPQSKYFLSDGGGQVIVRGDNKRTTVMFYIWRGILNNSSGFVIYTSDGSEPQAPLMHGARRIKEHWFSGVEY